MTIVSSPDSATEAQVGAALVRCAAGDRKALRVIYDAEAPRMVGVARRMLRRQDLVEEAVQDAFMRVWRAAGDVRPAKGRGTKLALRHPAQLRAKHPARRGPFHIRRGCGRSGRADDRKRADASARDERVAAVPGAARSAKTLGGGAVLRSWALPRRGGRQARRSARHGKELGCGAA